MCLNKLNKLNIKGSCKCLGLTKKNLPCNRNVVKSENNGGYCFSHINQNLESKITKVGPSLDKERFFKPFLKWVGGKQESLASIAPKIPKNINTYHEFFLGGGSVLLNVLFLESTKSVNIKKINVSDVNQSLINVYLTIKNNWRGLYKVLKRLDSLYNNNLKNLQEKKEFYLKVRNIFNNQIKMGAVYNNHKHAAVFIFLNKTCYRGLYSENKKGEFNVSFGNYIKPGILIEKNKLKFLSEAFQGVNFSSVDFKEAFKNIQPGDFLYLDPPYFPENKNSFVSYTKVSFTLEEHIKLFENVKLASLKTSFLLSNSNTQYVLNFFKNFFIKEIIVKNKINSKAPNKKRIEVLISNINLV